MKKSAIIKNGLFTENPTFVQLLGMCPTLAVTTSLKNGIGMGLSATAVTIIQMLLNAYFPELASSLGIFIPLIVVNCIILARAEAFASKNTVGAAAADGLGMGLGFTGALAIISAVREILGSGSILGITLFGSGAIKPMSIVILAPGGFIVLGLIIAVKNYISERKADKKDA